MEFQKAKNFYDASIRLIRTQNCNVKLENQLNSKKILEKILF